jgi:hypothetical protein
MELDSEIRARYNRFFLTKLYDLVTLAVIFAVFVVGLWWAIQEPLPK